MVQAAESHTCTTVKMYNKVVPNGNICLSFMLDQNEAWSQYVHACVKVRHLSGLFIKSWERIGVLMFFFPPIFPFV